MINNWVHFLSFIHWVFHPTDYPLWMTWTKMVWTRRNCGVGMHWCIMQFHETRYYFSCVTFSGFFLLIFWCLSQFFFVQSKDIQRVTNKGVFGINLVYMFECFYHYLVHCNILNFNTIYKFAFKLILNATVSLYNSYHYLPFWVTSWPSPWLCEHFWHDGDKVGTIPYWSPFITITKSTHCHGVHLFYWLTIV